MLAKANNLETNTVTKTFSEVAEQGGSVETVRRMILKTYKDLRAILATADVHLGTAFDLGRMLADTILLVEAGKADTFTEEFNPFRLNNAYGWLDDLHRMLPGHAADAVSGSLRTWEGWVSETHGIVPDADREHLTRALHTQGEMWRRLLSGERLAEDLLTAQSFKDAGARMVSRLRGLAWSFVTSWWFIIIPFLAAVGAVVWVIVRYAPSGATTTAALIATAAGSLGISWRTVAATLGRATAKVEAPLWDAEVRASIVDAATVRPEPERERHWRPTKPQAPQSPAALSPASSSNGPATAE